MRITGGQYRGRQFDPGKNFRARPTTDMAKESLFNILQNRIVFEDTKALDLFSGTGSISFELASRGCLDITSVELDLYHYRFIRQVIEKLGEKYIKAVKADMFRFVEKNDQSFDLIFADPPYDHPRFREVPELILSRKILSPGGLFILEHPKNFDFSRYPEFNEERNYGSVHFSFFHSPVRG